MSSYSSSDDSKKKVIPSIVVSIPLKSVGKEHLVAQNDNVESGEELFSAEGVSFVYKCVQ